MCLIENTLMTNLVQSNEAFEYPKISQRAIENDWPAWIFDKMSWYFYISKKHAKTHIFAVFLTFQPSKPGQSALYHPFLKETRPKVRNFKFVNSKFHAEQNFSMIQGNTKKIILRFPTACRAKCSVNDGSGMRILGNERATRVDRKVLIKLSRKHILVSGRL